MSANISIQPATAQDWPDIWAMIAPVFRAGQTYAVDRNVSEADAKAIWVLAPSHGYILRDPDGTALATYYLKPNFGGPAQQAANCGYIVSEAGRGRGLAKLMCRHSQAEAIKTGFKAMVFNCVVATNTIAVKTWLDEGFAIIGTLPKIFDHPQDGWVDAHIMHKTLGAEVSGG